MKTFFAFTITILLCLALTSAQITERECKTKDTNCDVDKPICARILLGTQCHLFKNTCLMQRDNCLRLIPLRETGIQKCRGMHVGPSGAPCK